MLSFRVVLTRLVLILPLALGVVACGGDDDDSPATTGRSATSTTTATAASATTTTPSATPVFPITVTDSSGTKVTFESAPRRIISYSPGATEILFAVGAGGQVVGVDKFSDYPAETSTKTKLDYSKPAPEPALALQPDLVIMVTRQEGQVEQFRSLGMRVLFAKEPADLPAVLEQVRLFGKITGREAEGTKVADALKARIDRVGTRLQGVADGPLVYYEVTADLYTVTPDTFIGALLSTAKAKNVATGAKTAFPQLSAEQIIQANPAVILLSDGGGTGGQSPETVAARPGWATIDAVKNGRVYVIDGNAFSRPGPRVVDALESLVGLLYPELK